MPIPYSLALADLRTRLVLDDGNTVQGFICESHALADARDISEFGGLRNFLSYQRQSSRGY